MIGPLSPVRYDRLTLEDTPGHWVYTSVYPRLAVDDPTEAARMIELVQARGYTHWILEARHIKQGFILDDRSYDYLDDPAGFLVRIQPVLDAGFWILVNMLPEGLSQRLYDFDLDAPRMRAFWRVIGPHPQVHSVITTELSEYVTASEICDFTELIHEVTPGKTIWYHFSTGEWYPRDSSMRTFWREVERLHPQQVGIAPQYTKTGDSQDGFLASAQIVRHETTILRETFGLRVLAGEYAHRRSEAQARALGDVALDAGAEGFLNGGPGYQGGGGPMPVCDHPKRTFAAIYTLVVEVLRPWTSQYARPLEDGEIIHITSMMQIDGAQDAQIVTWLRGHLGGVYPAILTAPDPFQ